MSGATSPALVAPLTCYHWDHCDCRECLAECDATLQRMNERIGDMANKKADAKPALPTLDSVETVAADTLPDATRRVLDADEIALATAIIAAATPNEDGTPNVARGAAIAGGRDEAAAMNGRLKRLLVASGLVPEGFMVKTRVAVAASGGATWGIKLVAIPADPDGAEPAEIAEPAAE